MFRNAALLIIAALLPVAVWLIREGVLILLGRLVPGP